MCKVMTTVFQQHCHTVEHLGLILFNDAQGEMSKEFLSYSLATRITGKPASRYKVSELKQANDCCN